MPILSKGDNCGETYIHYILHIQTLEQNEIFGGGGDPQEDVTGVGHPSQEEVDLGGGDGRRQAILHPQLFHRNKTTEEEKIPTDTLNCIVYLNISKFVIKL